MAETELERAEKRYAQAKARLQGIRNRAATRQRKLETRRKIILGGALIDLGNVMVLPLRCWIGSFATFRVSRIEKPSRIGNCRRSPLPRIQRLTPPEPGTTHELD